MYPGGVSCMFRAAVPPAHCAERSVSRTTPGWQAGRVTDDAADLQGDGLVLRPWSDADLAVLPSLFDDPEVARWTPLESPFDAAAARRYLDRATERLRTGEATTLAVVEQPADGVPVGMVLARPFDDAGTVELGYALGPRARGRRVASRALRLLAARVTADGARRLVLRIDAGNTASERVARACGFVRTAEAADGGPVVWSRPAPPA
jgi:RimJ/RimL family protein N-acetyltransferase